MIRNRKVYSDFAAGQVFYSPTRTICESDVMIFAGLSGDLNELHTSRTYAETTSYGRQVVHGLLVLSMANGLYTRAVNADTIFLGVETVRFVKPTFIGDTIYLRLTLQNMRLTKNPAKGILTWQYEVFNQDEQIVMEGVVNRMINTCEGVL